MVKRFAEMTEDEMEKFIEDINTISRLRDEIPCDNMTHYIECPLCGGKRMMWRASINGHLHTSCETEGCISFME